MKKTIILVFCFFIVSLSASWAQDEPKDFELKYGQLFINHASDEAFAAIEQVENKENKTLALGETASMEDFDKVCKKLPWITSLEVARGNKEINNIKPLKHLKNLEKVRLTSLEASKENPIDLAPLSELTKLKELDFYATKVTNTNALKSLTNLENVSFYMSSVDDISFVDNTPKLTHLSLYGFGHTFDNYEPVSRLNNLKELDIYMNKQATDENLEVLKALTTLETIRMANNNEVTSLDFLENCQQMREIQASWCKNLEDFSALKNMDNLVILKISDSKIDNLEVLKGKERLEDLNIAGTVVTDLSPIASSTRISRIDISKTDITDISPLFNNEKMWSVILDADIPQEQVDKLKSLYPDVRVRVNE